MWIYLLRRPPPQDKETSGAFIYQKPFYSAILNRILEDKKIQRSTGPWSGSLTKTIIYRIKSDLIADRRKRLVDPRKGQYAETQVTQLKRIGQKQPGQMPAQDGAYPSRSGFISPIMGALSGDPLYNPARGWLMLHAHRLTFTNPLTLETIQVEAPSRVSKKVEKLKKNQKNIAPVNQGYVL